MGILLNKGKNYIINGAMDFWQRGTSFASAGAAYHADRFFMNKSATAVHTISRSTDVPTLSQAGIVLPFSYQLALTTAQASYTATQFYEFGQVIEGQVFAPLAGKKITLSFWVKAALVGTYSVAFRNGDATRSLVRSYTINTANTWEKKTITITHDTTGTWDYSTGKGLIVTWCLASGSSFAASSENVWLSGNFNRVSSQVVGTQASATSFLITGIQLEEGESASNFERAGGNIANELILCQRYYEKSYDQTVSPGTASSFAGAQHWRTFGSGGTITTLSLFTYKVTKRSTPVVTPYNAATGVINQMVYNNVAYSATSYSVGVNAAGVCSLSVITQVLNAIFEFQWTADAEL